MKLIDAEEVVRIVESICNYSCPYWNKHGYVMCDECGFNKLIDGLSVAQLNYYSEMSDHMSVWR